MDRLSKTENLMDDEEKKKLQRPPSSYGSMKSDDEFVEEASTKEGENEDPVAILPECPEPVATGLQNFPPPETLYTMRTEMTKPPDALIVETESIDLDAPEDDDYDDDDNYITNSPEPPEPMMFEEMSSTNVEEQPFKLHVEQDLPYVFRTIQKCLSSLTFAELYEFNSWLRAQAKEWTKTLSYEDDVLEVVDKMIEILGQGKALELAITCLRRMDKVADAVTLQRECWKAHVRHTMIEEFIRQDKYFFEGVVQNRSRHDITKIYVDPELTARVYKQESRTQPPMLHPFPGVEEASLSIKNLFRLVKDNGTPVRTVVTTGLPGSGLTIAVSKFCVDWSENTANRDLEYIFKLPFRHFWNLKSVQKKEVSLVKVVKSRTAAFRDMEEYLEKDDAKRLVIMDNFESYKDKLDWENIPVLTDIKTKAPPEVVMVNIIRGNLLPGACVWILGRAGAVSQIPSSLVDVFTEIQGFSDDMKKDYLMRRWKPELAQIVVDHLSRLPMLNMFARHPFACWIITTFYKILFEIRNFESKPTCLTRIVTLHFLIQMNRRLYYYYGEQEMRRMFSEKDKNMLLSMGKMAFKMLERNTEVFYMEDLKEYGLEYQEVIVFSGMCTEILNGGADGKRKFSFINHCFQEYMAAFYVFVPFYGESKIILDSNRGLLIPKLLPKPKTAAVLISCALDMTLRTPQGQFDLFLRFLCGMLNPFCHVKQFGGFFFDHRVAPVSGLDKVKKLLEQAIETAPQERVANLKECLRDLTEKHKQDED